MNFFTEHNNKNVDDKCNWFVKKFYSLYSHNCPRKCKTISAKRVKPWITYNLKRMAKYKLRLFKEYKQDNVYFLYHNNYKTNLCRLIKESKYNYFINKFNSNKNNIRST